MKKILVFVLVLYIGRLFSSLPVLAANTATPSGQKINQVVTQKIDYTLPYPGVLPDNPIYFLKVLRDNVLLFLIQDRVQRSFYLIRLADKRVESAKMLLDKGETSLAAETAVQGEDYLTRAVDEAAGAKTEGRNVAELFAKLTVAGAKHDEVTGEMMVKLSGGDSQMMQRARQKNLDLRNRVREIFLQAINFEKMGK